METDRGSTEQHPAFSPAQRVHATLRIQTINWNIFGIRYLPAALPGMVFPSLSQASLTSFLSPQQRANSFQGLGEETEGISGRGSTRCPTGLMMQVCSVAGNSSLAPSRSNLQFQCQETFSLLFYLS